MVVRGKRRRCRFCNQLFVPDPRLKGRQIACSAPDCQRQRKEAGQEQWLSRKSRLLRGPLPEGQGLAEFPSKAISLDTAASTPRRSSATIGPESDAT